MICYADIESTAIPSTGVLGVEKIHCIAIKSENNPTLCYTSHFLPISNYGGTLKAALDEINRHDTVVFHNYTFDIPVIENLLGPVTAKPLDSMLVAKLLYTKDELTELDMTIENFPSKKYGSFSLEAFGHRIGLHKGDYNDWSRLTVAMTEYCTNDVEVTYQLIQNMLDHPNYPNENVLELEHRVRWIVSQQEYYGFYFDLEKARELYSKMLYEQTSIRHRLLKTFKPKYLPDGPVDCPSVTTRSKKYIPNPDFQIWNATDYFPIQYQKYKNGSIKLPAKTKYKYFTEPMKLYYSVNVGERQKIKLTSFDPGSRHKIRHWLKQGYDFEFATFTEKGTPKVEGEELAALGENGVDLRRYLKLVKDISQLKGLVEATREDSTVTSRIDTNGTVTGRFTSSSVNLNQIPAQKEFRELFSTPSDEWVFIGTDFGGQENTNLAEALHAFDNGRLDTIIMSGNKEDGTDLHSLNAKATGLSRSDSKPLWFGFLYGSSSTLTGYTLLGNKDYTDFTKKEWKDTSDKLAKRLKNINGMPMYPVKSGKQAVFVPFNDQLIKQAIYGAHMQERLISSTDGLADLIFYLERIVEDTGYITTLGGRKIPVDSSHKCLNYFCQGQGAEAMKIYLTMIHDKFYKEGLEHGEHFIQQATIYDEVDLIARKEVAPIVTSILQETYKNVSDYLGMKCTYTGEVLVGTSWQECH